MFGGELTDAFPVTYRVKQGVLEPNQFTHFLIEVSNRCVKTRSDGKLFNLSRIKAKKKVRQLCVPYLLYADDTGIVSHIAGDFQTILDKFAAASASFRLPINVRKNEVLRQIASRGGQAVSVISVASVLLFALRRVSGGRSGRRDGLKPELLHIASELVGRYQQALVDQRESGVGTQ